MAQPAAASEANGSSPPDPPKVSPTVAAVAVGYALAVGGLIVGAILDSKFADVGLRVRPDISIFAGFYIIAQVIERLLEPVSRLWENATDAVVTRHRADKEVVLFGVATLVAALFCGVLGIRFLESILELTEAQRTGLFRFTDLAITALVIGAGTKPLHDLIDRVQRPKQPANE
jgi:hypothetical protein